MANTDELSIFFAGDFCSTPSTKPIKVSEELKNIISSCDLAVINFEVPLKPEIELPKRENKRFYQHDDVPNFLKGLGFNLFAIANNHMFDWGKEGFFKTKKILGKNSVFGAGSLDDAYKIKVVELSGIKIGFMALSYLSEGVFKHHNDDQYACAYVNDLKVNHEIRKFKSEGGDFLIIMPHDGIEYVDIPMPDTIARYHDFIDCGADVVIGTHPHCPQGWERYSNGIIFYSLGNFFFNSKDDYSYRAWHCPHWYEGICVKFSINKINLSIDFEIINTLNTDNLKITIDSSPERTYHNHNICTYLKNEEKYLEYYKREIIPLVKSKYISSFNTSFFELGIKKATKLYLRFLYNKIFKKSNITFSYTRILENDVFRNACNRYLHRKN